jgi:hypothetical protein
MTDQIFHFHVAYFEKIYYFVFHIFWCILDFFKILIRFLELPKRVPKRAIVFLPNFLFRTLQKPYKNISKYQAIVIFCFSFKNLKNYLKFSTFSMIFTFYLHYLEIFRFLHFRLIVFWSKKSFKKSRRVAPKQIFGLNQDLTKNFLHFTNTARVIIF